MSVFTDGCEIPRGWLVVGRRETPVVVSCGGARSSSSRVVLWPLLGSLVGSSRSWVSIATSRISAVLASVEGGVVAGGVCSAPGGGVLTRPSEFEGSVSVSMFCVGRRAQSLEMSLRVIFMSMRGCVAFGIIVRFDAGVLSAVLFGCQCRGGSRNRGWTVRPSS